VLDGLEEAQEGQRLEAGFDTADGVVRRLVRAAFGPLS
jgi:hypothetical protein